MATAAAAALNEKPSGLCCVGAVYPGFEILEEMSRAELIDQINISQSRSHRYRAGRSPKGQT